MLLVIDAVIAGFGRLGEWFGPERWGMRPDMIVFAKGVTSGYLPLGGVVISGTIASPFWDEPNPPWFRHGPTYAGHPTSCAVALANLDIIEREGLLARGLELEGILEAALRPLESHALVGEVRAGTGALAAVALSADALAREPKAPMRVWTECRDRGVLVRPLGDAVGMSPALIATRDDIDRRGERDRRGPRRRRQRARGDRRRLARRRRQEGDQALVAPVTAALAVAGHDDPRDAAEVLGLDVPLAQPPRPLAGRPQRRQPARLAAVHPAPRGRDVGRPLGDLRRRRRNGGPCPARGSAASRATRRGPRSR